MKLPFIESLFGKKEKKEYFLALLLRDEKVTAVIFEELAGKVRVVGKNEVLLNVSLEEATPDEWLEAFDKAISAAEETMPEDTETQKTIFGVKETWVEDTKIKKEYLLRLKKASDTLGLLPIGFLVIHEAIAHLLQEEEGAPVSGILIEIGQKHTTVSLLRAGRVIETKRTASEDNVAEITDRILHHFTNYEVLPSRVLVLSDKHDNEKLSQSFISHRWSKSLPFLHVPQITILPKNFDAKAVLSGAATQMGFEFLSDPKQHPATHKTELDIQEEATFPESSGPLRKSVSATDEPKEEEENFGFIKNTDIRINTTKHKEEKNLAETDEPRVEIQQKESELLETAFSEEITKPAFQATENESGNHYQQTQKKSVIAILTLGISSALKISKKFLHFPKLNYHETKKKKLIILLSVFFITILAVFISYIFFIKATVNILIEPKIVEEKQDITFSTKTPTEVEKKTIIAQTIEINKTGKTTRKATGKKEIGEKAKGNITIYSNLTREQTFNKGALITSSNNLVFVLDETVKVASVSGASDGQKTVKAQVIARDIGKESNLPSGVKFTVASFNASEVEAKNDSAFSGGTKKEVTVVSKNDIASAIEELTNTLEDGAKQEMAEKTDNENKILPFITDTSFSQSDLDKKVDEEASSFTISGTVTYETLTYQESDMQQFVKNILNKDIDPDLTLDTTTYELQDTKKSKNNDITSTILAKAYLLPKLEKEKLAKNITGKSFADIKTIIEKNPQIKNVEIKLQPNIPFLPKIMPRFSENITINIQKE